MALTIDIQNFNEAVDQQTGISGSTTLNLGNYNNFHYEINGDVGISLSGVSTNPAGNSFSIAIKQDSTGNHSVTSWPNGVIWTDGAEPNSTGLANTVNLYTFVTFNGGSTWIGMVAAEEAK